MELTREEKAWLRKVQKVLDACPSDRLGFYTIGDPSVTVYDRSHEDEINAYHNKNGGEFCNAVDDLGCFVGSLDFPAPVHSTCG